MKRLAEKLLEKSNVLDALDSLEDGQFSLHGPYPDEVTHELQQQLQSLYKEAAKFLELQKLGSAQMSGYLKVTGRNPVVRVSVSVTSRNGSASIAANFGILRNSKGIKGLNKKALQATVSFGRNGGGNKQSIDADGKSIAEIMRIVTKSIKSL